MTCFSDCGTGSVLLYLSRNSDPQPLIEACLVWKRDVGFSLLAGGRVRNPDNPLVEASVTGMLACVVTCSPICRARSNSSRRAGCEGKLWPAERDCHDQDVLSRAFPSSVGYSEGSSSVRSKSRQCLDGGYAQSECITAAKDGNESEDNVVAKANDTAPEEEHRQEAQGDDGKVSETGHDRRLSDEAEGEQSKLGLHFCGDDISTCRGAEPSLASRMPATSTECLQISSRGKQLQSGEQKLRRFNTESQIEVLELEPASSSRLGFGEGAESVDHSNKGGFSGGRPGQEPQLAERGSSSHEFFGERLDHIVGSRGDERGGVDLSSSWGDNLRGSQEQLSFQGEDTVECNVTNVGEEDETYGFDVAENFQTPREQKHEETRQTESQSEFQTTGEQSEGGQDRLETTPSATFESPQAQVTEKTLRARAGSRLRSSEKDLESHPRPDTTSAGRKIPERLEAGAGRVGKGQEKVARGEGQPRKSEALLGAEERRVRARLDGPVAASGRGEQAEEASKVAVRPSRPSGGKDRHSKVNTAKGPRDRRVRLSVPTAVQFYDVQDRLGYDQPSKAVEWLIKKAKAAIDELGRLPARGNDGPSALSDINHASPYSIDLVGPLSSPSCQPAGSFAASLSTSPFGDHIGNHMSYFIDSSIQQGIMPFGSHPVHIRDLGGVGLSQAHIATGQGQLAGLTFPLGQTDLSRESPGCSDGGKPGEFSGSPHARQESRVKARERARERVKEKCTTGPGRDVGKLAGGGSSPSSDLQSPPLHQNPIHSSFSVQNSMQSSIHNLSLQGPHPTSLQSSISSVFNTTLSGIMQSSQQGTLQNLIMQNPSLQSPLTDPVQSSLQHPFQTSPSSQSISSMQNPGMQQQSHLLHQSMPSLEGSNQRDLHLQGPGFPPGPCPSSFPESASLSSSDFMSISPHPISQSLSMSHLSAFGISQPSSMGAHFNATGPGVHIPPDFSPGPPASAYRPRPTSVSQSFPKPDQQHGQVQGLSRQQCQLNMLSSYSNASASPAGSPSPKPSAPIYYSTTSSRMGTFQSISPPAESASFSSIRNVTSYESYQRGLQMMSPGQTSSSYQTSNSQLQMPARIQGLSDDFDDDLKSPSPSPSPVHP